MIRTFSTLAIGALAFASTAIAQDKPERPVFQSDGSVQVPAFNLPPSIYLSPEAVAQYKSRALHPGGAPQTSPDIAAQRRANDAALQGYLGATMQRYAVDIADTSIAGVHARIITPKGAAPDTGRILINMHGGGFSMCAYSCAMLESVPIAALGKFKVVTIDYRMAPEAKHPSAMEDLSAVYRELLKSWRPSQIGIYGCSAGGALTSEAGAWLPSHGLPQAGALGILGAGGVPSGTGDSAWLTGYIDGAFPPPPRPGEQRADNQHGYFDGADISGPIVSPTLHPEVLAKYPPTILVTGTRAPDMSQVVLTNSALIKAGVSTELIVGEGMGHCYIYQSSLPEARDAQEAIVKFFQANLH